MRTLQSQIGWCARVQWVLGGALVALVVGFYFFGYRPQTRQLNSLNAQIHTQRQELDANQSRTKILPDVALDVNNLRKKLDKFDKQLPRSPELGQFIKEITQVSQQSSLRKLTVQPGAPKRSDLFAELPIFLKFEGDFVSVFSFLRHTEDMQRLTRVRNLSVKSRDTKFGNVEVQLTMNIYFSEG